MSFLQLSCVVDHFVVVWDYAAFAGLLAHDEEIIVKADYF